MPTNDDAVYYRYSCPSLLLLRLERLLLLLTLILLGASGQAQLINDRAKSVLEDSNQIPPNIYQWIEQNAHVCTTAPLNGANAINFLNAAEGARCSLCPEPRIGEAPKVACAVGMRPNAVDIDIGCHPIPELCVLNLRERYAEFFAAGGEMPKQPQPVAGTPLTDVDTTSADDEIFETTGDPFLVVSEQMPESSVTPHEETTTVRDDQFTSNTVPNLIVNISTSTSSIPTNEARMGLRQLSKGPDENTSESLPIPPPFKRSGSIQAHKLPVRVEDDKNVDDRDQKAAICRDTHELCCFWAHADECNQNPFWMRVNCAKTCGTCNCKVQNANNCVSTGIQCQMTTVSSTRTFTTKTSTMTSPSSPDAPSTSMLSTAKTRLRTLPPSQRTRSRGPRPRGRQSPGDNSTSQPPGYRPQRPPFGLRRPPTSSTTVGKKGLGIDDSDYRPSEFLKGGDGTNGGDDYNSNADNGLKDGNDSTSNKSQWRNGDHVSNDGNDDNSGSIDGSGVSDVHSGGANKDVASTPIEKPSSATPSTTTTTLAHVTPSTARGTCFNYNRLCLFWAEMGECERNPFWMRPHCQKACNSCGEAVEDVLVPPQKPDCENHHTYCPFWAFIGECSANARWMSSHCRASCQLC